MLIDRTLFARPLRALISRMGKSAAVNASQTLHLRYRRTRRRLIYVSKLSGRYHHYDMIEQTHRSVRMRLRAALFAFVVATALVPLHAAKADSDDNESVRTAVEHGEIRSLAEILAAIRGKLPGEVAGVEIERVNERWVYEFRVVGADGHLFDVYVDARTAKIEKVTEK